MSGAVCMLLGVGDPVITLASTYSVINSVSGMGAFTTFTLESDGDIIKVEGGSSTDLGDWIVPKGAAPGTYEARATLVTGTLSSGTTGSWLALTSNRSWSVNQIPVGSKECVIDVEIRKGSGSTLATTQVTLFAERL